MNKYCQIITKARCLDGVVRVAMQSGEPTSQWSTPAKVVVDETIVDGILYPTNVSNEWLFSPNHDGTDERVMPNAAYGFNKADMEKLCAELAERIKGDQWQK